MKMTIGEIARALNAPTDSIDSDALNTEITNVSFDTRQLDPGALFVPLVGENDGHNYVDKAVKSGALATFWDRKRTADIPSDIPVILVNDTLKALQTLSKYYLQKINPRVVAITGSNGKTTTKDMVAAVLAQEFNVTKTKDNFNNEIGVPFTILQMEPNTEALVIELGMDRPGQLDFLSKLVEPDVSVITMIGEAHIEFFGTRDKIADAKMEITHGLKEDGYFVFNGDEPLLRERAVKVETMQKTFGIEDITDDLKAIEIKANENTTYFKTNLFPEVEFSIPLMGDYNVSNALAAIMVGDLFRLHPNLMVSALKNFELTKNRTQWLIGKNDEKILSDVYNSNPTAVREVLQTFEKVNTNGRRIVVLGDMLELGTHSKAMHIELSEYLDPQAIAEVYLVGMDVKALSHTLNDKFGKARVHYYHNDDLQKLSADLNNDLTKDDVIMLKASHGIHLEKVVADLIK